MELAKMRPQIIPTPKPQRITRSKTAVIDHIRETASDKIDVLLNVTTEAIPQTTALLRKIAAKNDDNSAMLIVVVTARSA